MKKIIASLIIYIALISTSYGQFEVGVKAGISSFDLASDGLIFRNDNHDYKLNFDNADYGVHFGIYSRISFLGIYIEPAILFNSNTVNFQLDDLTEDVPYASLISETYRDIDIPFLIGTKLGFLRLQAGPVAHFYLDSTSDLFSLNGYTQNFKRSNYGGQIGLGVDLWRFRFDMLYETNFSKFGEHIEIEGEQYAFSDGADRIIMTLGIRF